MPSLIDRYLVRETLLPFLLSLLLITFLLIIPPILQQGYALIAQGVQWSVVARVLVTLLPQALSISIPMAVLMGLLIAFGRLSADREFVAMQACGVSVYRLLRPVAFIALALHRRHRLHPHRRAAQRQPDVSRNHRRRGGVARREQRQAARVLRLGSRTG